MGTIFIKDTDKFYENLKEAVRIEIDKQIEQEVAFATNKIKNKLNALADTLAINMLREYMIEERKESVIITVKKL